MSPTTTRAIRATVVAVFGAGAVAGIVVGWKRYLQSDPYAEVPKVKRKTDPNRTIAASGVQFKHYENGKLVASAQASGMTVNQDRSAAVLHDIKNGMVQSPQGPIGFSATTGVASPNVRRVDASGNVHVWNKASGLNVTTTLAQIDGNKGEVRMPATLKGTIGAARMSGTDLTYNPGAESTSIRTLHLQGKPPKGMDLPAGQENRSWDIDTELSTKQGMIETANDARATDGEVIVMAPKIVRNVRSDVITATGRATYRSARADIVADQIIVHQKEGYAVCTGNVVMLQRPKTEWDKPLDKAPLKANGGAKPLEPTLPKDLAGTSPNPISAEDRQVDDDLRSGKTLNNYPMNLTAEEVTYWYHKGERHAIAKGGTPTAFQRFDALRWRTTTAPEAHYDGEKDLLDLVGDKANFLVHMKNSIGDKLDTIWLKVSTKEDQKEEEEYMQYGKAKTHFVDRGDDDNTPGGAATPPKKGDPTKGPPPVKGTPPPGGGALVPPKGTP